MFPYEAVKICVIFIFVQTELISLAAEEAFHKDFIQKFKKAGFNDHEITTIHGSTDGKTISLDQPSIHRHRRDVGQTYGIDVHFKAFGEFFYFGLNHTDSVLHSSAVITTENNGKQTKWEGQYPDCFLTGDLQSHNGTVSASFCNKLTGIMSTENHELHFEDIPDQIRKRRALKSYGHSIIVARKLRNIPKFTSVKLEDEKLNINVHRRNKRSVPSTNFTIELAVYVDEDFLANDLTQQSTSDRINAMLVKYNAVAYEWGRADSLHYNVTLSIKRLTFFDTNPEWYNTTSKLSVALESICVGTADREPYDHVHVHTGVANPSPGGIAYQDKVCSPTYRCGVSADGVFSYITTAHEIGHNMGMIHDADAGCQSPDVGLMGGAGVGWSSCSAQSMDNMLQTGNHNCLWEDNIDDNQIVPTEMVGVALYPGLPGQQFTNDEICEKNFGQGFRYRAYMYPRLVGTICSIYSCVDLNINEGGTSTYGQMFKVSNSITGSYCEDNKVCFKGSCQSWSAAQLTNPEVRGGGWSNWGSWTSCSRTCGRGMSFRKRICNNPTPKNHAPCEGNEYEALGCNTSPCPGDSPTDSNLIYQRAHETCANLIENNIINGTLYRAEGELYATTEHGVCEVECKPKDGYETPSFTRFGLIEQGTPCSGALNESDANDYPRRPGFYWACLEGYCHKFDCANTLNDSVYDGCGVCDGDNSTCLTETETNTDTLPQWGRKVWTSIPVGAYNIEMSFVGNSNGYYIEIWTKENSAIIASGPSDLADRIFNTGNNPIYFGATFWYFKSGSGAQIMYAKGPIDTPVIVKIYNYNTNANTGINYFYAAPLDIGSCTGICQNGGTWNSSLCACNCPSGYSGTLCSSQCPSNPKCKHGAPVNEATCECICNDKQYGSLCECLYPYTGKNCSYCKHYNCENGGTFNALTCRCECPEGYGGLQCESTCVNAIPTATCNETALNGSCTTDSIYSEENCMVSCNLCQAKPCTASQHTCTITGKCIERNQLCDGKNDCYDGADENVLCIGSTGFIIEINSSLTLLTVGFWMILPALQKLMLL